MTETPVRYARAGRIARITLNRPDRLNAIDEHMPPAIREAVRRANDDPAVRVIVLEGAGRSFCAGYDLQRFAEAPRPTAGSQDMPWDPTVDYRLMGGFTDDLMSLWRSLKPVVCKVQGHCVAGGTDIALSCDLIVAAEDARFGYPPARVWGVPQTGWWVYRVGPERAKRLLLTGDTISGTEAARIGLVSEAVPPAELDAAVQRLAERMAGVPLNQLIMNKLVVNQAMENMGLRTTQMLSTFFDGVSRHTPEGVAFKARVEQVGFKQAVAERDRGEPAAHGEPE